MLYAVTVQPDGKIVAVGTAERAQVPESPGTARTIVVARYHSSGALDTSFSGKGWTLVTFPGQDSVEGNAVALQPDGKIVVAGRAFTPGATAAALARLNADGSPDASFGSNGRVVAAGEGGYDSAQDLVIQGDGKILTVGYTGGGPTPSDLAVARHNADGSLDASFGSGGIARVDVRGESSSDVGTALELLPDGRVLAAGNSLSEARGDRVVVTRLLPNGQPDAAFGQGGTTDVDLGPDEHAFGLGVQDGRPVVLARVGIDNSSVVLARFTENGALDGSFGSAGKTVTPPAEGWTSITGFEIEEDGSGRLLVAATEQSGTFGQGSARMVVLRYTADGALDGTFGSGGRAVAQFPLGSGPSSPVRGLALAIQPDGRIVAAGSVNLDLALARFMP